MRHGIATVLVCTATAAAAWGFRGTEAAAAPKADRVCDCKETLGLLEVLAQDLLPPAEAIAKAAKDAGTAVPYEIELDSARKGDRRVAAWEIDYLDGDKVLELKVDARTGEVLSRETETDAEEVSKQRARLAAGKTGLLEALAASGKGLVLCAELDGKAEKTAWETRLVHSGKASSVAVSVVSGKVVAGDDDDKDEDDDDDGEDEDDDEDDDAK